MSDLSDAEREALMFAMCAPDPDRAPVTEIQLLHLNAVVGRIAGLLDHLDAAEARAARLAEVVARVEALAEQMDQDAEPYQPGGRRFVKAGSTLRARADATYLAAARIRAALASPASVPVGSVTGSLAGPWGEVAPESTPKAAGPGEGLS